LIALERGIGAGIAFDLGILGANVVITHASSSSAAAGDAVVEAIRKTGSKAVRIQADVVASSTGSKRIVEAATALSSSGKVDILVHNAGHGDDRYLEEIDEDFYTLQTNVNMKGRFWGAR
jgi:3-oxoacyl-[acyl-carrier protein] reductase